MTPEEWSSKREGLGFLFFKGGVGEYVTSPGEVQVKAGDVLIFGEGSQGKLRASRSEEVVFWFFSLRLEHLYPLFCRPGDFSSAKGRGQPGAFKIARRWCLRWRRKVANCLIEEVPPQFDLDYRGQLLRVAAAILAEEFKMAHQQRLGSTGADERVAQIFETLSADELVNLSVSELAEKFGCGPPPSQPVVPSEFWTFRRFAEDGNAVGAGRRLPAKTNRPRSSAWPNNAASITWAFSQIPVFKSRSGTSPGRRFGESRARNRCPSRPAASMPPLARQRLRPCFPWRWRS